MTVDRYARQVQFPGIGPDGQQRLAAARVAIVGVGALGTALASQLVRAGVGYVRLIDGDTVELTNLPRQVLFDEADLRRPKATAAAEKLRGANSHVTIESAVQYVHGGNAAALLGDIDVLLDGTDNFATRFLINDYAVRHGVPWVHGAIAGSRGTVMTVHPGETPCLRCLYPEMPTDEGCHTRGVIGPIVQFITALQAAAALKLLTGHATDNTLTVADVWETRLDRINLAGARRDDCPVCGDGGRPADALIARRLCGRNAVAVWPASAGARAATRAERSTVGNCQVTMYPDGRAHFYGTDDTERARELYEQLRW